MAEAVAAPKRAERYTDTRKHVIVPTRVVHPDFAPGRRIIAVSDIHGNIPFFKGLLKKINFSKDDILVIIGDILEKGPESVGLMRYVMELQKEYTVYPMCGNCDGYVLRFFEDDAWDQGFFSHFLPAHPESTLRQLADEMGFENYMDMPAFRQALREHYPDIWQWLRDLPIVLETEHLVFVHGGVPTLEHMEELDGWRCMKNDDFMGQGHSFGKYVIVGHWPVTLYHPDIPSAAPIIDREHKIISIDGGCVLKLDGQLNALIIPEESSDAFTWQAFDGLPTIIAKDAQQASRDSVNVRWGRSRLEMLKPGQERSLCRHLETGRELMILNDYLHEDDKGLWCEDSTDYCLSVEPGDKLKLVEKITGGALCKKNGATGWYFGEYTL